tara:strand:- start:5227 stop:5409 length:183 start_codon:yes stop_codon:yes gene_type:complete
MIDEEEIKKEIKLIGRRTEETLHIIVDHFKEVDERLEELEDRIEELEQNSHTPCGAKDAT